MSTQHVAVEALMIVCIFFWHVVAFSITKEIESAIINIVIPIEILGALAMLLTVVEAREVAIGEATIR